MSIQFNMIFHKYSSVREEQYGVECENTLTDRIGRKNYWMTTYVPPAVVCDGLEDCTNGDDEHGCEELAKTFNKTCLSTSFLLTPHHLPPDVNPVVHLTPNNTCTVPNGLFRVCANYLDQINCSHALDSPLECKVDGYDTTVTRYALCKDTRYASN